MRRSTSPSTAATGRELCWFGILSPEEQREVVCRLADQHRADHDIAAATKLDLATVRRIIAQRDL